MRALVSLAIVPTLVLWAAPSHAISHYLLAKALDTFTHSDSVTAPDLTPMVEAIYEAGTAGSGAASAQNRARVNSDTGFLGITSIAAQPAGQADIEPKNWKLVARLEQAVSLDPGATGIHVSVAFDGGALITHTKPARVDLSATLYIGNCMVSINRTIYSTTGEAEPKLTDGCQYPGATVNVTPGGMDVRLEKFTKGEIHLQIDPTFVYSGVFAGTLDLSMDAKLKVEGIGGGFKGTSPTFLSQSEGSGGSAGEGGSAGSGGSGQAGSSAGSAGSAAGGSGAGGSGAGGSEAGGSGAGSAGAAGGQGGASGSPAAGGAGSTAAGASGSSDAAGASGSSAGASGSAAQNDKAASDDGGDSGCAVPPAPRGTSGLALAALALGALGLRRRR